MQDYVAAPGIAVFRFADGADVDGVPEMVLAVGTIVKDAVIGLMGMAKTHNVGIGVVHDAEHTFFFAVFKQIFVDLSRAAMD